ncbi:MAG: JAB domain-containing protein [Oscillospiraceae bacterium]
MEEQKRNKDKIPKNNENSHGGHRGRLDEKSKEMGLKNLPEHEQLEKILFVAVPRGNTNEMAHELLQKFGSMYGVLIAEVSELVKVKGVGVRVAEYLHDMLEVVGILERSKIFTGDKGRVILDSDEKVAKYVKSLYYDVIVETFYMISLNTAKQVIKFDKVSEGTIYQTDVYARRVSKIALMNEAHMVILAHNHPGQTMTATMSDIDTTQAIIRALKALEISVYDHLIVSGDASISFRDMCIL